MWRPRGTDEDGRDGKQLPTLRGKELQEQITTQHFAGPASWSTCVYVSVCAHTSRIPYQCSLVNQVLFKGLFQLQFLNLSP